MGILEFIGVSADKVDPEYGRDMAGVIEVVGTTAANGDAGGKLCPGVVLRIFVNYADPRAKQSINLLARP